MHNPSTGSSKEKPPLVVDMDGTLLRVDVIAEWTARLLLRNPLKLLQIIVKSKDRLELKNRVAAQFKIADESFPFNNEVLQRVKRAKESGRNVYLATATIPVIAEHIARNIGLFDGVFSSTSSNLRGDKKAQYLNSIFGIKGYDYIGNSKADYPVWTCARKAVIVGSSRAVVRAKKATGKSFSSIQESGGGPINVIRQMRVDHWLKNALLFLPLILAGSFTHSAISPLLSLFVGLSLVASSLYILNDVNDLQSDRIHPEKRMRPLASGDLRVVHALFFAPVLMFTGLTISFAGAGTLGLILIAAYGLLSTLYTVMLKRFPLIDIFALSVLYTFRVFIGATISETYLSFWLVLFSFMTFSFLASLKRVGELQRINRISRGGTRPNSESSRGYAPSDLHLVKALGISLTVASLAVLGIYAEETFHSESARALSFALIVGWAIWSSNLWLDVERGRLKHDPVRHALRDKKSILTLGALLFFYINFLHGG